MVFVNLAMISEECCLEKKHVKSAVRCDISFLLFPERVMDGQQKEGERIRYVSCIF